MGATAANPPGVGAKTPGNKKATRRWLFFLSEACGPRPTVTRRSTGRTCLLGGSAGSSVGCIGSGAGGSARSGSSSGASGVGSVANGGTSSRSGGVSSGGSGRSSRIGSAGSSVSGAGSGIGSRCNGSRRFSGRSRCCLFFFAASGQSSSGDQGGQNERFIHFKSPQKNRNSYPEGFRTLK